MSQLRKLVRGFRESDSKFSRNLYNFARKVFRWIGRNLPWLGHLGWVTSVRTARWIDEDLVITGWAYHRGTNFGPAPKVRVWLSSRGKKLELAAEQVYDLDILGSAKSAEFDYSANGFSARITREQLETLGFKPYVIRVEISGNNHRVSGPVRSAYGYGSVATARMRQLSDGTWAGPYFTGTEFRVWRRAAARSVDSVALTDGKVSVEYEGRTLPGLLTPKDDSPNDNRELAAVEVDLGSGAERVEFAGFVAHDGRVARADSTGRLETLAVAQPVCVESVEFVESEAKVTLTGRALAGWRPGLRFESSHHKISCEIVWNEDGSFEAAAVLRESVWGGPVLPVASGVYELITDDDSAHNSTFLTEAVAETLPRVHRNPETNLRIGVMARDQLVLLISRPRTNRDYGSFQQRQLRARNRSSKITPTEGVFFESFFGRNATCNPYAMDRYIARVHPELPRYWGVTDYSIAVPEGATALVRGSEEWWRVRSSVRSIVTNEWLGAGFDKKGFQTVLQTWHGSMYKRIGFDRAGMGKGHRFTIDREKANWDLFISQASTTTPIIERAYDLAVEKILEVGYPRNDELTESRPEVEARVKQLLGIPEGVRVVLYAPTWRDQNSDAQLLDVHSVSESLGDEFVVLNRAHVRTLKETQAVKASGVRDVSTYPQLNDLYRISDLLVTDYSSMMFDFSVLDRPMLFYTPDLSDYSRGKVRGSYFDLKELAPGPVFEQYGDAVEGIRSMDDWAPKFASIYEDWRERYNLLDDGFASERAVQALLSFKA